MESANHDKFGKFMEILKGYCEEKKEEETKKKEVVEEVEEKRKKKRLMMRGRSGGMQLVRDSNGNHILTGKTYAQAKKEQILREEEEEKKLKKEGGSSDDDDSEPDQPRWSDENLALHLWRGVCRDKGVNCHEYLPRTDYHNMSAAEVRLDLLWRKVYKAEAEAAAAAPAATATS